MYGLPQAGIIAQNLLTKRLHKAGYQQSKITPGYRHHNWRPIRLALVVDNFGVKYINKEDIKHLASIGNGGRHCQRRWLSLVAAMVVFVSDGKGGRGQGQMRA